MSTPAEIARAEILRRYEAALRSADPALAVQRVLTRYGDQIMVGEEQIKATGRVVLIAVGKAASAMTSGAFRALGDRIDSGIVLTKDGHSGDGLPPGVEVFEAGHPIPDQRGVAATRHIIDRLRALDQDDLPIFLISGGGSALLESPVPPLELSDVAALTQQLLLAGAPIQDLNVVRSQLSAVKAGRLRQLTPTRSAATLLVSDVLSNDPAVIASGPTVAPRPEAPSAMQLLEQYGLAEAITPAMRDALLGKMQPVFASDTDIVKLVASNDMALDAAIAVKPPAKAGWRRQEGEAAALGKAWVQMLEQVPTSANAIVGGGEAVVAVHGDGVGGRNSEFVLSAALEMHEQGMDDWVIASISTDGQDAMTGAAGAFADSGSVERIREAGIDPVQALAANDSATALAASGDLLITGPTGTNVADLYFAVHRQ